MSDSCVSSREMFRFPPGVVLATSPGLAENILMRSAERGRDGEEERKKKCRGGGKRIEISELRTSTSELRSSGSEPRYFQPVMNDCNSRCSSYFTNASRELPSSSSRMNNLSVSSGARIVDDSWERNMPLVSARKVSPTSDASFPRVS